MELEEFLKDYKHDEKDEYILIHLTDYMPENGTIYSNKGKGVEHEQDTPFGKIKFKDGRDTVHFAVNGCVSDHNEGSWKGIKYAILIPVSDMIKENGNNIASVCPVDFYIKGNVKIPENALIVTPKVEESRCQEKNNGINVISHNNRDVREFIEETQLISKLGYTRKEIGENGWLNSCFSPAIEDMKEYKKNMAERGYARSGGHWGSVEHREEISETFAEFMKSLRDRIKVGNYLDTKESRLRCAKLLDEAIFRSGINFMKTNRS